MQLAHVTLDRRSLDLEAELADFLSEDTADLRVERFELDHALIIAVSRVVHVTGC